MQFNRCLGCMEEISGYPCPNCGFDPRVAPAFSYALPLGAVLNGHCVVGKVLGQGGFGITYIGFDLNLERKVAIKEFYPKDLPAVAGGSPEPGLPQIRHRILPPGGQEDGQG